MKSDQNVYSIREIHVQHSHSNNRLPNVRLDEERKSEKRRYCSLGIFAVVDHSTLAVIVVLCQPQPPTLSVRLRTKTTSVWNFLSRIVILNSSRIS